MQQQLFIFSNERTYRLRRHAAFWICWWLFFGILYAYTAKFSLFPDFKRLPISMMDSFFFLIPHMFLTYSLIYFVVPKFVVKGRYLESGMLVLVLFFVVACMSALLGKYVLPFLRFHLFSIAYDDYVNNTFLIFLLAGLRGAITIGGLAAAIKLMKYWYSKEQRNLQLEKENMESQLQLLKAQIHPHFLFNTLNNIYSFTQTTSPAAAKMVTGLSDLLRFILYEGSKATVPLSKELQMLEDYINLEKIRYGNKLELHIDMPAETNELFIAPLLLLPLVENCFKHGTSNVLEQPWIHLQVSINHKQLHMKLMNGKVDTAANHSSVAGIGLNNVRQRLLLLYPDKHELTITSEEEVFIVNLKLELEQQKEKQIIPLQQLTAIHA